MAVCVAPMNTSVLDCTTGDATAHLQQAAQILRAGGLVAIPTETVYGLAAHALDSRAVERIYAAKGRPSTNPLIVHVATVQQVLGLVATFPPAAQQLAQHFWPGPLTLVLPKAKCVPDSVTAGGPTVAIRIPAHPLALRLLSESNLPLAAPSANRSMRLSPTTAAHVLDDLSGRIDLVLDAGQTPGGIESTVVDLSTSLPRLLRPGLLSPAAIEAVIGKIDRTVPLASQGALSSPGLLEKHYAPHTPLECVERAEQYLLALRTRGVRAGLLTHRNLHAALHNEHVEHLPADPVAYASGLFAALHRLDRLGLQRIVVEKPPLGDEWLAIHDRLRRGSSNAP